MFKVETLKGQIRFGNHLSRSAVRQYAVSSKVSGIRWYNLQEISTVNKEVYTANFRRLGGAVRRKHPEKYRTKCRFFLHDNAPAHRSVFVNDFLVKNNVTTLEHPLHCPDMTLADFYLFLRLKSPLKGRRFYDANDIIKNAAKELKRLSQNGFHKCSQKLYSRWQMCTVA